jgi:LEA14-like dessication related protein
VTAWHLGGQLPYSAGMRALFSTAAGVTLAVACSTPSAPTLAPEKVAVNRVDMTGLALDISMSATNPNSVDLTASGVSSHVVVDKTHDVGTVTLPTAITLPAGKTTRVDVPLTMNWSDFGALAQLALAAGAVPYTVDGTLEMGGNLLHVGVPFHFDGTITHAQILAAMMNSVPVPR